MCANKGRTMTCHNKSVAKHKLHTRLFPLALQNVYFSISLTLASPVHPLLPYSAQCHVLWVSLTSCSHSVRRWMGPDTVTCAALSERGALSTSWDEFVFQEVVSGGWDADKVHCALYPLSFFQTQIWRVLQCGVAQHWKFFAIYLMWFAYRCFLPHLFLAFNFRNKVKTTFIGGESRKTFLLYILFMMRVCMKRFVCWWKLLLCSDTLSDSSVFHRIAPIRFWYRIL